MDQDIMKLWTSCEDCAINKHQHSRNLHPTIKQHPAPSEPWHTLNADFLTIDEHHHVLVIIDDFSKFVFARLTKKQGAMPTIKILKECFTLLGFPKVLRSDNGAAFKSAVLVNYLEDNRVEQYLSSAYNHKSNGLVKRYNRNIRESLRLFKGQSFDDIILHTTYSYNHSKHTTTKAIPAKIIINIPDKFIGETYINNQMSGNIDIIKWSQQFNNNEINSEKAILPIGSMVWKRIMGHTDK